MQLCAACASDPALLYFLLAVPSDTAPSTISPGLSSSAQRLAEGCGETRPLGTPRACVGRRVVPSLPASPSQPARGQTKRDGREGEKRTGARAHRPLRSYSPTLAVEQSCREQSRGELGFTVCAQPDTRKYRSSEAGHVQAMTCIDCKLAGSNVVQLSMRQAFAQRGRTACLHVLESEQPSHPRQRQLFAIFTIINKFIFPLLNHLTT